ncbi:hypothetical protein [Geomonas sp.]|uniref:hypothetical protein n=1 Tax=Geomonas sp. TaxID=2651584 RepID=UPI002B47312A|nr:hypothetical protein [Geomonas sp.]HJV34006.1 hypothetical protein [Geomonas sp.]
MCRKASRRPIGRILKDGGFLTDAQLADALEEQRQSNELIGQVLVRSGVLTAGEVRAALAVQEQVGDQEQAIRLAAGVRLQLGSLLLKAGRLSEQELERALAEQQRGGDKLGEICLRLGLLTEVELQGLLAFQRNQCPDRRHASPLRLGELLVSAGHISRKQLVDALRKQAGTRKTLGEVLVEEGYALPAEISHGVRLQELLMSSALAAIFSASPSRSPQSGSDAVPAGV